MQRHLERHHPEVCPTAQSSEDSDSSEEGEYDQTWMDHAAYDLIGEDLDSFSCLTRKGMRRFVKRFLGKKRLGGRKALTAAFMRLHRKAKDAIKTQVAQARADNCFFTIAGDAYKSKGTKRNHYHCLFLSWVDPSFELHDYI